MKKHVTIVGAIQVGFGTLGLIAAFVVYFALSFAKGFIQNEEVPNMILGFLRVSLPVFDRYNVDTRTCWWNRVTLVETMVANNSYCGCSIGMS